MLQAILVLTMLCATGLARRRPRRITGTVSDPSGAVIPSASISIVNVETGAQREATADGQGRYTIQQVTPGTLQADRESGRGFADVALIEKIELLVNQPATLPITFEKLGSTTTTVQVEAAAAQVNTTDASLGNAITSNAIIEMPMYARNVAGLLAFQPGVTSFGSLRKAATGARSAPRITAAAR